jgi:hypothetical protein
MWMLKGKKIVYLKNKKIKNNTLKERRMEKRQRDTGIKTPNGDKKKFLNFVIFL